MCIRKEGRTSKKSPDKKAKGSSKNVGVQEVAKFMTLSYAKTDRSLKELANYCKNRNCHTMKK